MKSFLFVFLLVSPAFCREINNDISEQSEDKSYMKDLKVLFHLYEECSTKEWSSCLKIKLISAVDRVAKNYNNIKLTDGVTLLREENVNINQAQVSEETLEQNLPRTSDARDNALNTLLFDKLFGFLSSYTLKMKLASPDDVDGTTEARGKKHRGLLMLPILFAGTMLPIALGGLALLAGKALIISKLALLLAGIIALKKLLSGHHDNGGGRRLYAEKIAQQVHEPHEDAHKIAYSSYVPHETPKTS